MASYIRCPSCGGTFSEEAYKNHSCKGSIYGGASDLRKGHQETAKEGGTGER